jgi:uncharacterized membrane protein
VLLGGAIAAYAAGFAALSVLRHRAFNTGRFDLGNMVQAVWSTAHGDPLEVTSLTGEQFVRLGAHFDPILVLFTPLWVVWPSPSLLVVTQAFVVALGALPVFWLGRAHLGSERAAVGFALAYLLLPAVQWMTLSEFHPVALATPLLLFAFWYLDQERFVPFTLFAVLAVATKEHVGLALAGMGVWYLVSRRRALPGAAVIVAGVAVTALAVGLVIPHFSPSGTSSFYGRYDEVGGSPGGILETAVTDPGAIAGAVTERRDAEYLAELVLPLAGLALLAPLALLVALPELGLNLLSATDTQTSIHFHYSATVIAGLVAASVLGAARLERRRPGLAAPLALLAVVAALVSNYVLGGSPAWRAFPGAEKLGTHAADVAEHDRVAADALRLVPDKAVVSASNWLGGHLSERRRVLSFPLLDDAEWIAVDETQPGYADRIGAAVPYAAAIARVRRDPHWELVYQRDGVLLFRRARDS